MWISVFFLQNETKGCMVRHVSVQWILLNLHQSFIFQSFSYTKEYLKTNVQNIAIQKIKYLPKSNDSQTKQVYLCTCSFVK